MLCKQDFLMVLIFNDKSMPIKPENKSNNKAIVPKVNAPSRGTTFYYLATCLLLLLMGDKQYRNPAKGLPLFLRKWKRVCKLLVVQILFGVFKYLDKYYRTK
ncbi:hypothetical protein [Prevotella pallens]|uniref:hypothetical protein n=1 Tax=Prevotella pallens TaxID=60133 RepID=UPI0028E40F48|nr:hypothetical protein [Prevotella pallens]